MLSNSLKISIVTIVYNGVDKLQRTINSVAKIKLAEIEFIVIDGNSNDGTLDLIKKNKIHIDRYISEPDDGIYDAMNKGIDLSSGEYIIFMNAGDVFYEKFNSTLFLAFMLNNQEKSIFYSDSIQKVGDKKYLNKINDNIQCWWNENLPSHQCCFVSRKVLEKNKFKLSLSVSADSEQLIQIFENYESIKYQEPIAIFELGGVSNSWSSLKQLWCHLDEMTAVRNMTSVKRFGVYAKYIYKYFLIQVLGYQRYYQLSYKLKRKQELK